MKTWNGISSFPSPRCDEDDEERGRGRRDVLVLLERGTAGVVLCSGGITTSARDAAAAAEDLVFPTALKGSWTCTSTERDVKALRLASDEASRRAAQQKQAVQKPPVTYIVRFIQPPQSERLRRRIRDGGGDKSGVRDDDANDAAADTIGDDENFVVLDRGFSTSTLVEGELGPGSVEAIRWDATRPDRLVLRLRGGIRAQSDVLRRRQFYASPTELHTVELLLQTVDNTERVDGNPTLRLAENETVYTLDDAASRPSTSSRPLQSFTATQTISMFALPADLGGDAVSAQGGAIASSLLGLVLGKQEPTAVYKYDLIFTALLSDNDASDAMSREGEG